MSFGTNRVTRLDPSCFMGNLDLQTTEEAKIRRQISLMYMALFNFWAAAEYYLKGNKGQGKSGEPDDFREQDFDREMIRLAKSREIKYLALSRNACDHRLENPANKVIFAGKSSNAMSGLRVDNPRLSRGYVCFQDLLSAIKKAYNLP